MTAQGQTADLLVEWREYPPSGPLTAVAGVTITITRVGAGSPIVGPTSVGVTTMATGINAYSWDVPVDADLGDYLVLWEGEDGSSNEVTATETVTVTASLGILYATLAQLKSYLRIEDGDDYDDDELGDILAEVSREIDSHCSRRFWADDAATARTFPGGACYLPVHDIWSTDDLEIDGVAWPITGLTLLPRNGVVDGIEGWPYTAVLAGAPWGAEVTVTAKWGWAAVPTPVRQSCLILAAATVKLREQPGGPGGFGEWGGIVKARDNPHTTVKLAPYRLDPAVVA